VHICWSADHAPRAPIAGVARFHTPINSDSDHTDVPAGRPYKPFNVVWVACENYGFLAKSHRYYDGINHIRRHGKAEQPPGFMGLGLAKRNDHAPSQETPELGLLCGPADLGDHRRRNQRNNAKF
jgi:hypothetical protein